jgi:hypothetical protein
MTDATILDDYITKYSRWGKWGDDDQDGPQPRGLRSNPQLVTTATGTDHIAGAQDGFLGDFGYSDDMIVMGT